jgi:hypothetical protein
MTVSATTEMKIMMMNTDHSHTAKDITTDKVMPPLWVDSTNLKVLAAAVSMMKRICQMTAELERTI